MYTIREEQFKLFCSSLHETLAENEQFLEFIKPC